MGETLAEVEGVEPHELEPTLHDHVDRDVFEILTEHDGSPWQLLFYTDEYEVRVGSFGTVTVSERPPLNGHRESTESAE